MPHITTRLTVLALVLALGGPLLLAACGGASSAVDRGADAYAAGDYEAALASFRDAGREEPSALVLYDTALAALATGDLTLATDAAASAERAATDSGDSRIAALATFVRGNAHHAHAILAGEQADTPESEPFAFDVALSHAENARDAWKEARAARGDWPEADRNVRRAERLIEDLMAKKAEAADRKRQKAAGGPPKVRLRPMDTAAATDAAEPSGTRPPPPPDGAPDGQPDGAPGEIDPSAQPTAGSSAAALPREAVLRLLDALAEREREKDTSRRAERARTGGGVERDW